MSSQGPTFYADLGKEVVPPERSPERGSAWPRAPLTACARTPLVMALYLVPLAALSDI